MHNHQSRYCYPGTDVLINKLDIRDQEKLEQAERRLTHVRLTQLQLNPINGQWDLSHLQHIHNYLFQDIYPFCGEIRNESISKGTFTFCVPQYIDQQGSVLFKKLRDDHFLKGLVKEVMCKKLAFYFTEINILHPFREGNGRTEREFLRTLAYKNGYTLDWNRIDREELMQASVESTVHDEALIPVMRKMIVENNPSLKLMDDWLTIKKSNR
ncbi:Fic family protein [Sporolactobacillus sp. STCC-11]|uniref:Fic/DOC family protein n=1 Tax=Sporolactobacillus caesalpiniae TaxID=3230362 RepID=UPI0033990642